ncbi:unnamed protein product [Mytilus coruscus]|uniref:Uncharacterized protein n=1 Tax=Mytilus coruscus TaxID=42192 RepID=A0A6J8DNX5_MYTCO|nr:unnamed protein product [Mytilus coruscus]
MDLSDNSGWIQLDECRGYASNIHQAEEVSKTFEVSKRSTFVSYKTVLNFGKNEKIPERYRLRFSDLGEEVVPYDETPFIITGRKVNSCIFGKDKHVADKKKKQQDKASNLEFDVHVKHKLKEVIEMTELQGNARRLGFTHRHYLTVKDSINNSKLQATLDKMLDVSEYEQWYKIFQKDVLFVEAEILVVSHIKKITVPEADRLLHPLPSLKR